MLGASVGGAYTKMKNEGTNSLQTDTHVFVAWGNLGNVLKNQGKMAEAEKAYRNALQHRGNMADMLYNL